MQDATPTIQASGSLLDLPELGPDVSVDREQLHRLIWSRPIAKLAKQFGVSDSYLVRVCRSLQVPRPARGHWVKIKAGKRVPIAPLTPARPGLATHWYKGTALDKSNLPHEQEQDVEPGLPRRRATLHPLVRRARPLFENSRPIDEGAYLKPFKRLLVDIVVSKGSLDTGLALANAVFLSLEAAGHRVAYSLPSQRMSRAEIEERRVPKPRLGPRYPTLWSPWRSTLVHIGPVPIGLALIEISEEITMHYVDGKYIPDAQYLATRGKNHYKDSSWTTQKDVPSGKFRLVAYAPQWDVDWSATWDETKEKSLKSQIPHIVSFLGLQAKVLVAKIAEADRKAEADRLAREASWVRYKRQQDREDIQKSKQQSQTQLEGIIALWAKLKSTDQFLEGVAQAATSLPDENKNRVMDRLALAHELLGSQEPLEHFLQWLAPAERYTPLYEHEPGQPAED